MGSKRSRSETEQQWKRDGERRELAQAIWRAKLLKVHAELVGMPVDEALRLLRHAAHVLETTSTVGPVPAATSKRYIANSELIVPDMEDWP